jgi:hypothetical protein
MIYREPGFLGVLLYGPYTPPPPALSPVSKLDRRHTGRPRKRDNFLTGEGMGDEPNHSTTIKPGPLQIIQYSLQHSRPQKFKETFQLNDIFLL